MSQVAATTQIGVHTPSDSAPAMVRAGLLAAGVVGLMLMSIWIPWLDRDQGQFVLSLEGRTLATLSNALVIAVIGLSLAGAIGLLLAVLRDGRIHATARRAIGAARAHPLAGLALCLAGALGAIDFYELFFDPFQGVMGRRMWMLREDLQAWLILGSAICAAAGISALWPNQGKISAWAGGLRRSLRSRQSRLWLVMFALPLLAGGVMARFVLEGIPHFSDALTYLMQGRMLLAGDLAMPAPPHIDLWQHSLFFVTNTWTDPATGEVIGDGSLFFGKYPIGWPAILGAFDALNVGYLANGVLTGLLCVLTGLVARQFAPRRIAIAAGVLLAASPWAWFSAANFASHAASACAVMGFLLQFLRAMRLTDQPGAMRRDSLMAAAFAGLFLGAGVLIRPQDSMLFCLPAVGVVLWRMMRDPKRWCVLGPAIAVGALVGVGVYMAVNQQTTGLATLSPYQLEDRWSGRDWNPSPPAMAARFFFQAVELTGRMPGWGIGGLTIAVAGAIAAGRVGGSAWRNSKLRLVTASTVLFFLGSTPFGFTNVWWGPRWLLPAAPLIAILGAYLLDVMLRAARRPGIVPGDAGLENPFAAGQDARPTGAASSKAAQFGLCVLLAGVLIVGPLRYVGQAYAHRVHPPHAVSGAANDRARAMGLGNDDHDGKVVIAMPTNGLFAPLDARAGIVYMSYPFAGNSIVYVRAVEGWQSKAGAIFPDYSLYELVPSDEDREGFVIVPIDMSGQPASGKAGGRDARPTGNTGVDTVADEGLGP